MAKTNPTMVLYTSMQVGESPINSRHSGPESLKAGDYHVIYEARAKAMKKDASGFGNDQKAVKIKYTVDAWDAANWEQRAFVEYTVTAANNQNKWVIVGTKAVDYTPPGSSIADMVIASQIDEDTGALQITLAAGAKDLKYRGHVDLEKYPRSGGSGGTACPE